MMQALASMYEEGAKRAERLLAGERFTTEPGKMR